MCVHFDKETMTTIPEKEEGFFYDISECYGLFACSGDCEGVADYTLERNDGKVIHLCTVCREKGGWV